MINTEIFKDADYFYKGCVACTLGLIRNRT